MSSTYLAFDLGAESGRAVVGTFAGGLLDIHEVHRFANEPVRAGGSLHWDVLRLWHEIQRGMSIAAERTKDIASIGVDTWGVDYALLTEEGSLLENPYHYRDERTDGMPEQVFARVPANEVYAATGIQFMQINTLFQVFAATRRNRRLVEMASHLLTIPDLLNYWLTNTIGCEFTNATTTQMLDPRTGTWATEMLTKLDIPVRILPQIVQPGTRLGPLREPLQQMSGLRKAVVIAPACHDTGSAVAAVKSTGRTAFISSGTWSLMGAEISAPIINEETRRLNFTNEGGVNGTIRLLKNITGMWLLQGCRKQWSLEGLPSDYAELVALGNPRPSLRMLIDPNDPMFLHPASMTEAIRRYCQESGQPAPERQQEFVQLILESLALSYRRVLESLQGVTGREYEEIRVVGGGARNRLLNQFTADATGRRVVAGPVEATALGNLAVQMAATGAVSSIQEAREVIDRSFPTEVFEPSNQAEWKSAYERFAQSAKASYS